MVMQNYDIVGSYNNQRVSSIDAERSINLFEYIDPLGKKNKSLLSTSGIIDSGFTFPNALSTYDFRGTNVFNDIIYISLGNNIYKITSSLIVTQINTSPLTTLTGYVGMDANQATNPQIIFVDGQRGYIYDSILGNWTIINDPNFPAQPVDVCYLDGFFVVANGSNNTFQLSQFNQGLIWGLNVNNFTIANATNFVHLTSGTTATYPIGLPIQFTGVPPPAELSASATYYVVSIINSMDFTISATLGGSPIGPFSANGTGTVTNNGQLQLGSITSHPGTMVACRTLHRRLFLFSQNYTEVWENAGAGTNLPFRRNNSLLIEYGCSSIGSIQTGFDTMFFMSRDQDGLGSVMQVLGTQAVPISTRALDFTLSQYAATVDGIDDATAILLKENGIIFYRLNFTSNNHTFVYNVTQSDPSQDPTKFWHEEEVLNGDRHPAQTHAYINGNNYVGSYDSPTFYQLSPLFFTNDGEAIKRIRIGKSFCPESYQRIRIDRFHLDVAQGFRGLLGDQNKPSVNTSYLFENQIPRIFLSISKDGGVTYGSKLISPMGKVGYRTVRTVWRKIGTIPRGQSFVPKIEFYNYSPFSILGAAWQIEVMPE